VGTRHGGSSVSGDCVSLINNRTSNRDREAAWRCGAARQFESVRRRRICARIALLCLPAVGYRRLRRAHPGTRASGAAFSTPAPFFVACRRFEKE